jgi:hypothetical protein
LLAADCAQIVHWLAHSGAFFHCSPVLRPVASLSSWMDGLSFHTCSWAFHAWANMT